MTRLFAALAALLASMLALVACGGSNQPPAALPLAADRPTFFYFYTDN